MKQSEELEPLEIAKIFVMPLYGLREQFNDVKTAISFVESVSRLIGDDEIPLDRVEVIVEFKSGEIERCAYHSLRRTVIWLKRFSA